MSWVFSSRLEEFEWAAGPFLRADPARNTVLLGVLAELAASGGQVYGVRRPYFGWWAPAGAVTAACLRTPPHNLLVSGLDRPAAIALAAALRSEPRAAGVDARARIGEAGDLDERIVDDLPGVTGRDDQAEAFAQAWLGTSGAQWRVWRRLRLYRLGQLVPPSPWPPGAARVAAPADRGLAAAWYRAFAEEVGDHPAPDAVIEGKLAEGRLVLWELADGTPVSMAGRNRIIAGAARVGPVYTPADHRGRGYGGAVTAAVTRAALDHGAGEIVLFTDQANPVSNSIYQRLGYQPVEDQISLDFRAG